MGAFHAYDIRGIYGQDFDKEIAYKVGYFVPGLLKTDRVLVGHDCRVSSPEIHQAVVRGITDAGADVYDMGLSSTPMVYFGTAQFGFEASIQITASHNSAEYNGMKVSRRNALPVGLDAGLGQIKEWIDNCRPTPVAAKRGQVYGFDVMDKYLEFLRGYMTDLSGLKVSFDLSNGMANLMAKQLFGEGFDYIFDTLDGRFPNHDPNPLIPANVQALRESVLRNGSDVGVIFDGDADRVMFVDERGGFISPDLMIALMGMYFIGRRGARNPRVLQDIRSSKAIAEFLGPMGADVNTWKVGRAFAAPRLREIDGLWGGELAGHYYFKDFFYSDSGMLASTIILGIVAELKQDGMTLSQKIAQIATYRNSGEINFRVDDKQGAMDAVRDAFISVEKPTAMMDFDGYRVEFPQWWFNIRPSNTEPLLRFLCEANSDELLSDRIAAVTKIISERFGGERV